MKNIKRILNLILITLVILSAFMATNALAVTTTELDATAISQKVTPELDSVQNNKDAMADSIVEKWEYLSDYDMFCSQRGVEVWNVAEKLDRYITLTSEESGYKTINVGHIYQKNDTYPASGYTTFSDKTSIRAIYELMVEKDEDGNIIPNPKVASPEKAYILSEMFNNTNEHENRNVIEFQEDEDGKEEVEDVIGPALLEHYYVFSILEGDTEVRIYKIYGTYWKYDSGFLIPIIISEEEVYDAVNYNRSYVQRAWWRTDESKNTTEIDGGKFSQEAKAFEEYILDITGKDSVDELEYQETEYEVTEQFGDGTTKVSTGTVTAPVIEYTPEWVEIEKTQDVLWDADNERYLVGPFAIDYYTQADDIVSEFKFAGIESSTIVTNIGNLDLDLDGDLGEREYTFLHNQKIDSAYPAPNSEFYIVIPYIEGLKELYNIEFKFKYMNAGGEYVKYKGTAYKETWGISGNTVKKVREEVIDLQDMTQAMKAARWYEETTLSTNADIETIEETYKGNLKIVKNVVDEKGNPIQVSEDKIYKFKVTTIRPNEDGEYKNTSGGYLNAVEQTVSVKVAAGTSTSSVLLEEETWKGDKAPLYEVEEIGAGTVVVEGYNYAATELKNASGKYEENTVDETSKEYKVVEVIANNIYSEQKYEKGKLRIVKEILGEPLSEEKVFEFLVKVNIDGEEKEENINVVVSKGSKTGEAISKEYVWEAGKTATYQIEEINVPEDFEKVTGTLTGNLVNNDVKEVVAQNRQKVKTYEGKIQLIKKLVDENGNAKVATENQTFTFDIFVNGDYTKTQSITVEAGKSFAEASEEIKVNWTNKEGAPSYEVKEKSHATYKQVSIENSTGVFEQDKVIEVTAINTKEEVKRGNLKIIKVVDKPVEVNTEFEFKVTIAGETDTIKVVVPKGATEAFEITKDYYWKGTAPTYKVEEINIPSNYKLESITNSTGSLEKNKTIEVTAKNNIIETHQGKIKIIKTLKDGKGNIFVADKDYTFKFNVAVEGKGNETIEVKIKAGESEKIEESSAYTWTGEIAPKYVVTEIDSQGLNPTLSNATGVLNSQTVEVTAVNTKNLEEYEGKIKLYKQLLDENGQLVEAKKDSTFHFRLYVTFANGKEELKEVTLTLNAGQSRVESGEYLYKWLEGELAPTFRVEEKTPEGDWKEIAIENDNNQLIAGKTVVSDCYNSEEGPKFNKGELHIAKKLTDGVNNFEGKEFKFRVKVDGHDEEIVTIKAGDSWAKEYTWEGDEAPSYTVTEISRTGYTLDSMTHKYQKTEYTSETGTIEAVNDGKLKANNTVVVEAINKFNYGYTGSIGINKKVELEDKITIDDVKNKLFKFKVTIYYDNPNEYFTYNGKAYNTLEVFKEINGAGEISPITIKYEQEGNGPKYIVEETEVSEGWELVSVTNAEGIFKNNNETIWADFTNRLPVNRTYIFTMELGGIVWNDTNYSNGKPVDSENDGLRAETEEGIANVIINIYKRSLGTDTLVMTLLTDGNGKWSIPEIEVPYNDADENAAYYVTYTYDGQTYQPTKLLASGNAAEFKGAANNKQREKYLNNSMAIENSVERNNFNNKFAQIWGESPIREDGTTLGRATGAELEYISKDVQYNGYSKKESELVTLNADGTARYKMTASTAESGLFYPFDKKTALVSVDKFVLEEPTIRYTYHAAYPYLNSINLGLVERPHADIAVGKDLEEAIVVVNGKIYKYKYGEIANTQFAEYPDLLYKQIQINQRNIEYTLNLYKSDYYYRASVYKFGGNVLGGTFDTYLRSAALGISEGLDSLNLDVYLTYKVSVTNESDVYDVTVNQISDYVDSSLELVTAPEYKYVADKDGNNQNKVKVADSPEWNWTQGLEYTDSTAGWREDTPVKYTRYTSTSLNGTKLASGETASSKLTFKVKDKEEFLEDGTHLIQLGDKNNIVEIDNYSTYYKDGSIAGRVDEDSAPGNIDIQSRNSINWYEDDTDSSPTIKLGLYEEVRNVNGIAWEDEEDTANPIQYNQIVGNGLYEDGHENLIQNMTTKLVEKVTIDGKDYDFIWPTGGEGEDNLFKVDGKTIYELTGFDSTTVTGVTDSEIGEGKYAFTGIPAGNYVVRFTYGDDNTLDVSSKDAKGNIKYSGQDYKSTTYQVGTIVNNDSNGDGYIDNQWHDLESPASTTLAETRVSDARDDESRRLEVIRKSQELRYENTSILNTGTNSYTVDNAAADDYYFDDALNTYYMEANTAKLNMNIESVLNSGKGIVDSKTGNSIEEFYSDDSQIGGLKIHVLNANKKLSDNNSIDIKVIKYNVNDIDFGVESRSENNIKLDKQIEQITLKTSAGDILIDAKYSIDYTYNFDGGNRTITPVVELIASESIGTENLQALNRTSDDLGFRYLNVDKDILQGATITIKYRITALNTGEVDRCAELLKTISDFDTVISDLRQKYLERNYTAGTYLGQIYYQGATIRNSSMDKIVSSKVKQVVDYVDNDVVFSQMDNMAVDSSWANTTTAELEANKLIDKNIKDPGIGKILDSNGVAYESDSKNNLIVSVENADSAAPSLSNPILMRELVPYDAGTTENNSFINVTVSRYYSSDMDIEEVENIAETLKLYNDVGRRDLKTIQGNTNPTLGANALLPELPDGSPNPDYENDLSVTELITLSPPTGTVITAMLVLQVMAVVLAAMTILAGGIVIIKKKVLIK